MMMYQLPIDMMARIASVTRATMSLPFSRASRPYGLSTSSVVRVPAFAAGAAGAGGGGGGGVAAGAAAEGVGVCALAAYGTTAEDAATNRTAASAAIRVVFSMESPDKLGCDQSKWTGRGAAWRRERQRQSPA